MREIIWCIVLIILVFMFAFYMTMKQDEDLPNYETRRVQKDSCEFFITLSSGGLSVPTENCIRKIISEELGDRKEDNERYERRSRFLERHTDRQILCALDEIPRNMGLDQSLQISNCVFFCGNKKKCQSVYDYYNEGE